MSTPCYICKKESANNYVGIYVHYNGYPEKIAPLLLNVYNTGEKVTELISMGAASYITSKLGTKRNNFDHPDREISCFYHRDRDEELQIDTFTKSELTLPGFFTYVFEDNCWYIVKSADVIEPLQPEATNKCKYCNDLNEEEYPIEISELRIQGSYYKYYMPIEFCPVCGKRLNRYIK